MDKVEVVTELRIRREVAKQIRNELVRDIQQHCQPRTELNEVSLFGWERRKHAPDSVHAKALCAHFDVSDVAKLGVGWDDEADLHWTYATTQERRLEVDRRLLLRRGVEFGVAALLPVGPLTALGQRLGSRLRIGPGDVLAAERIATRLAVEYLASPDTETARAAVAHARTLTDRLAHASLAGPTVRTRLMAVSSDAAALAAEVYSSEARRVECRGWCEQALTLAREAGDGRLEALALTLHATHATQTSVPRLPGSRAPSECLAAMKAAVGLGRHLPPAERAYVHGYLGRYLAGEGEDAGSGRAVEQMARAAERAGHDGGGWGWWSEQAQLSGWADTPRAVVFSGLRPWYLGRIREAVPLFGDALEGTVAPARRAETQSDLSFGWAELDDPDRASAAGIAALDQSEGRDLGYVKDRLRAIRRGWPAKWDDLECIRALDERLATA
ncbi:MAG: hypothetical protein ACRDYX_21370 [Egibacteraceae bacterium]